MVRGAHPTINSMMRGRAFYTPFFKGGWGDFLALNSIIQEGQKLCIL
ncbi:hypothetical protein PSAR109036_09570 [Psychrobacter arenosus]